MFNSSDHWVINSPLPQKCSETLPAVVTVSRVEEEENDVCMNRPSTVSIIPTSSKLDSASTAGIAGSSNRARRTASAFLIPTPKYDGPMNGTE